MENEVESIHTVMMNLGHLASRRMLHEYGITDAMIDEAEARGAVTTSGRGLLAWVTDVGYASRSPEIAAAAVGTPTETDNGL